MSTADEWVRRMYADDAGAASQAVRDFVLAMTRPEDPIPLADEVAALRSEVAALRAELASSQSIIIHGREAVQQFNALGKRP